MKTLLKEAGQVLVIISGFMFLAGLLSLAI